MTRKEISGLHLYNKSDGIHVLFDEINFKDEDIQYTGPRQLSIMLTKKCNLECSYCYASKGESELDWDLLKNILEVAHKMNVLDITLGGGEPTLYSRFDDLVKLVNDKYYFGLSVTTNGTNIEIFKIFSNMFSKVRVSLDNQKRQLDSIMTSQLQELKEYQAIGINLLYSKDSNEWLINTINKLEKENIKDILIIPEHTNGKYILTQDDWSNLEQIIIDSLENDIDIKITSDAEKHLNINTLETSHEDEYMFLHIDDEGNLKERSWETSTNSINKLTIEETIQKISKLNPRSKK
ncbi:radical SAM protein [Aliarcobacter cryaerophilus]|nr:radical SAM protein [Aliarcobacter cryaerophilus]